MSWKLPAFTVSATATAQQVGEVNPWGIAELGVEAAWGMTYRGENCRVGVLDTGIDTNHPDFQGAIAVARNLTSSGGPKDVTDVNGHGTHTAGTIGSRDNGRGIKGVAPKCELAIYKVLGNDGSGSWSWIAEGLRFARQDGCHVVSMSLGSPDPSPEIQAELVQCIQAGILVVCAVGNDGKVVDPRTGHTISTIGYPAAWGSLALGVGAIDKQRRVASFSSRGPQVDVMAPGVQVLSCWPGGKYAYLDGTSMATPFIAGVAALLRSTGKKLTQGEFERLMTGTATPLTGGTLPSQDWGYGVVNALKYIQDAAPPPTTPIPTLPADPQPGETQTLGPIDFLGHRWTLTGVPLPDSKAWSDAT